ncbi:MAG: hypothetical protein V4628_07730, partial [Pseudomonadota bacterium]
RQMQQPCWRQRRWNYLISLDGLLAEMLKSSLATKRFFLLCGFIAATLFCWLLRCIVAAAFKQAPITSSFPRLLKLVPAKAVTGIQLVDSAGYSRPSRERALTDAGLTYSQFSGNHTCSDESAMKALTT